MKETIFLLNMGKVASTKMGQILEEQGLNHIHGHSICYTQFDGAKLQSKNTAKHREDFSKALKKNKGNIKAITLVRNPLKRNLSGMFQRIDSYFPNTNNQNLKLTQTNEFVDFFINKFNHDWSLNWFDNQIKSAFNIDVFKFPFDKELGYTIIDTGTAKLLIIQMEKLSQIDENIFATFFGKKFRVSKPRKRNKIKYNIMKDIMSNHKIPKSLIDKVYDSKLATHFYSQEDLDKFKSEWSII